MVRIYWKKRAIQFTNGKGDREDVYVRRGSSFGYFSKSVCCEKRREQPLQRAAEKLAAKFENTGSKVNGSLFVLIQHPCSRDIHETWPTFSHGS